jgi:diguanylate cyclase (GGDEF)-like protein
VVKDVRIEPGTWVVGHVYSSRRPVVVRDVRQLTGKSLAPRPYRTFSFAAVPIVAGAETVGVLSATDKRDGSAFDRQDSMALRTFGVSAALALVAARSETEVHRLAYAATVDGLTGLFNRHYFDVRLHQELERAKRSATSLTLLLADVDDFKAINDTYGHQTGDAVLRMVGGALRSAVRVFDICARYGGDEMAILMPSSDRASAIACAERVQKWIAESAGRENAPAQLPTLTVSIGVAVFETGDAPADLLHRADQCLYEAKSAGKNRVWPQSVRPVIRPMPLMGSRTDEAM